MHVLALEPFYGGSHRAFLDGLIARSRHRFTLLTQPACFWKWRMRGAAITLADQARRLPEPPDVILASDMLALAEFKALSGLAAPALLYLHENQLSYPAQGPDPRDIHFGFTNLTSGLAATRVLWNSQSHLESFLAALPGFIAMMPDCRPRRLEDIIRAKSLVMWPGLDLAAIAARPVERDGGAPLIIWNHRWEHDKQPEVFFRALDELGRAGIGFRLALLGENFQVQPQAFRDARERWGGRIVRCGYVEDRQEYFAWLARGAVSVSTAAQENFGLAAVEAAYAGAYPLWPDRLSYPELIGPEAGRGHLYSEFGELVVKLKMRMTGPPYDRDEHERIRRALDRFDWSRRIGHYDDLIESTATDRP
jgi:glycosyltransferase involved in cell wall biosynthesis